MRVCFGGSATAVSSLAAITHSKEGVDMESIVAKLLQDFEQGKVTRRQLIQSLTVPTKNLIAAFRSHRILDYSRGLIGAWPPKQRRGSTWFCRRHGQRPAPALSMR